LCNLLKISLKDVFSNWLIRVVILLILIVFKISATRLRSN
jgi:hypothetical protein